MVDRPGFEPGTSRVQTERSSRLSYRPTTRGVVSVKTGGLVSCPRPATGCASMRLIVEVEPTRRLEKLYASMKAVLESNVWMVAVPDAPLGKPKTSALMLASFYEHAGIPAIAHMRLRDINRLAFEQLVWGAALIGVKRILFLRGDPPPNASDVNDIDSVEASKYVKTIVKPRLGLKPGVYLSLRHPKHAVIKRIHAATADFYTLNWFEPLREEHREVIKEIKGLGAEAYAYLILNPRGAKLEKGLERQPVKPLSELCSLLDVYEKSGIDAVILSAPGHLDKLLAELREC